MTTLRLIIIAYRNVVQTSFGYLFSSFFKSAGLSDVGFFLKFLLADAYGFFSLLYVRGNGLRYLNSGDFCAFSAQQEIFY